MGATSIPPTNDATPTRAANNVQRTNGNRRRRPDPRETGRVGLRAPPRRARVWNTWRAYDLGVTAVGVKVMVVDDTDHVRTMLAEMLELDGFEVVAQSANG